MNITFPIPEGMVPPDGVTEGSTFDALATLKLGSGSLALVAIDGLPVGEMSEESPDIEESDDRGFDEAIRSGMME